MTIAEDLEIVRVARKRGDYSTALAHLEEARSRHRQELVFQVEIGDVLRQAGRLEEAEAAYQRVLEQSARHFRALLGLGSLALQWGDPQRALAHLEEAITQRPESLSVLTNIGRALYDLGRFGEAEAALNRVIATDPSRPAAWRWLGQIARQRYDWKAALEAFQRALANDPEDPNALAEVGNALCDFGRWDEGETTFKRALEATPTNLLALLGLVRVCRLRGDRKGAETGLAIAAKAHPNNLRVNIAAKQLFRGFARFDWKSEIKLSLAVLNNPEALPRDRIEACFHLVEYGIIGPIEPTLSALARHSSRARKVLLAARALERSDMAFHLEHADTVDVDDEHLFAGLSGVAEWPSEGADTLVIVFSGRGYRLLLGLSVLCRALKATGASIVYFRDLERTRYFGGVVGVSTDFKSTLAALREIARRRFAKRILMIGQCTGSAAALRYGLDLGAEAVLAISPRIRVPAEEGLTPEAAAKFAELGETIPEFFADVGGLYADSPNPPKATLLFGETCEPDASDAMSMAKARDVVLAGIPDHAEHDCIKLLLQRGLLAPMLSDFVATGTIGSEVLETLRSPRK